MKQIGLFMTRNSLKLQKILLHYFVELSHYLFEEKMLLYQMGE